MMLERVLQNFVCFKLIIRVGRFIGKHCYQRWANKSATTRSLFVVTELDSRILIFLTVKL